MQAMLTANLDYIFLIYGASFLILALLLYPLSLRAVNDVPWKWLCLFGLLHGINEWLDMLVISCGDTPVFAATRLALMTTSFMCLVEFGRVGDGALGGRVFGRWIFLPLLAAPLLGCLGGGITGMNAAARYAFGFVGGTWTAWVLWRRGARGADKSPALLAAAAGMLAYALATGLVVPQSTFFPSTLISHDTFLAFCGFPVQLLRALMALLMAVAFWRHCFVNYPAPLPSTSRRRAYEPFLATALAFTFIVGWIATDRVGRSTDETERERLAELARVFVSTLDPQQIAGLSGSDSDLTQAVYLRLKETLTMTRETIDGARFCYLMRQEGERIFFLADSESVDSKDYSPPGQLYEDMTKEDMVVFEKKTPVVVGPEKDSWGTWVTALAPLCAKDGTLVAVFGVDVGAKNWVRMIAMERLDPILITVLFACLLLFFSAAWIKNIEFTDQLQAAKEKTEKLNTQLVEAITRANNLSQQRLELLHLLSHDLKNPFSNISSLVELCESGDNPVEILPIIKQAASHGIAIIDIAREMQAIESGKKQFSLVPVDFNKALDEATYLLKDKLEEKHIRIERDLPPQLSVIAEEHSLATTVLANLLTNAVKFSHPNSSVYVSAEIRQEAITISIGDKGIGIPATLLPHLFDFHHKTSRQGTAGERGTGFGMPLVKKFMEAFGGAIEVRSDDIVRHPDSHGTIIVLTFKKPPAA